MPPKPRAPDASLCKAKSSEVSQNGFRKNALPFQDSKKCCYMMRSAKNSCVKRTWWWGFLSPIVKFIILWRKALPGGITLHAKLRVPIKDWSSTRVADFFCHHDLSSFLSRSSLSRGRRASIFQESSTIPRNSITVVGPSVFPGEIGIPKA